MYSTPVLEVVRCFGARDITECKLLNYDVICGYAGRFSRPTPAFNERERERLSLRFGKL